MITQELYDTTIENEKTIRALAARIYLEWQDVLIEELGEGLCRPSIWQTTQTRKSNIRTMELREKDVYINARKEGALKIPSHVLWNAQWKDWLRKKVEKKKSRLVMKRLSE
jgi:hypothetical protein